MELTCTVVQLVEPNSANASIVIDPVGTRIDCRLITQHMPETSNTSHVIRTRIIAAAHAASSDIFSEQLGEYSPRGASDASSAGRGAAKWDRGVIARRSSCRDDAEIEPRSRVGVASRARISTPYRP